MYHRRVLVFHVNMIYSAVLWLTDKTVYLTFDNVFTVHMKCLGIIDRLKHIRMHGM